MNDRSRQPWSSRLRDGRLRVQCQGCYDAGLEPQESVRDCSTCWDRARRKRAEMGRFRQFVSQEDPPNLSADSAPSEVVAGS